MIILPDRNIARGKFLMPMRKHDWYGPHPYGPDVNIHFNTWVAQAFRFDHSMVWHGHFEDREDIDEFMFALLSGTLKHDRYLQRLPFWCCTFGPVRYGKYGEIIQLPIYCPDGFDPDMLRDQGIMYNVVSNIGIGPSTGNWGAPGDCYGLASRAGEFIDATAAGGSGGTGQPGHNVTGGGGGGFARLTNLAMTPGSQWPYGVYNGGAGVTTAGSGSVGNSGVYHTWFWQQANPGLRALVGGGGNFVGVTTNNAGGAGGGADAGAYGYGGGRGGTQATSTGKGSILTGGGAAAYYAAAGANGGDVGAGGQGGTITAGGASAGLVYGPWGPGSGGNGTTGGNGVVGMAGGHYGGGGGGCANNLSQAYSQTGGAGGAGLLVIRYEPQYAPTVSSITPNSGPTAGGQAVRIGGSYVEVTSANIGGAPITGMTWNATDVYGTTSAGGAGTYNVNVYRNNGPSPGVGASLYTYVAPPTVSSCSPALGLIFGGTDVTITGTLMSGTTSVTFGGTAATNVVVVNASTITCKTPAHAAGLVSVVVTNGYGSGTGTNVFTFLLPASGFNMPMMGI